MKIEAKMRWKDLTNVEVEGFFPDDLYIVSAYNKAWDRELTEDECDDASSKFSSEVYESELKDRL